MTDVFDEFSFLPAQAAEAGIAGDLPAAERLDLTLADGRTLSALRYGGAAPEITLLLAAGVPALAIDLPGHGDSSWREDAAYVGRVLAPDVIAGIQAWTDRPQLLVGQSLGGLTAAAVTASRPDLVRALVVIDITPGIDPNGGASQIREFFAGPTDWADRDELVDRALSFGLGGSRAAAERGVFLNSRVREDGRVEWKHHFAHIANRLAADPDAAAQAAAQQDAVSAVLADGGWDDLAAAAAGVPVTLIRGDQGYLTDDDQAEFSRRLPAASVVVVPAGHNVQEQLPVELGRRLREAAGTA